MIHLEANFVQFKEELLPKKGNKALLTFPFLHIYWTDCCVSSSSTLRSGLLLLPSGLLGRYLKTFAGTPEENPKWPFELIFFNKNIFVFHFRIQKRIKPRWRRTWCDGRIACGLTGQWTGSSLLWRAMKAKKRTRPTSCLAQPSWTRSAVIFVTSRMTGVDNG